MFKVGRVIRYYDKTQMALVDLVADLASGEKIKIYNKTRDDFEQVVTTMKHDFEKVTMAKRNEMITIKMEKGVDINAEIYKA